MGKKKSISRKKRQKKSISKKKSERSRSHSTPEHEDLITEASNPQIEDTISEEIISQTSQLEDIITSDDLLCSIVSSLPLREAVGTCVLSRRWKHIWTNLSRLRFDAANLLDAQTAHLLLDDNSPLTMDEQFEVTKGKTDQFIQSVYSVLQQHQGSIHLFYLEYFLHKIHSQHLDEWVRFAVESKVTVLCLHLQTPFYLNSETENIETENYNLYEFPCQLLATSSLETLNLTCCTLKPPCNFKGLSLLKKLYLFGNQVTNKDIDHLIANCYTLEELDIRRCTQLETLSLSQPLSQLKILTVRDCEQLTEIKIDAPNLIELEYWGNPINFILKESLKLKYANIIFKAKARKRNLVFYLNKIVSSLPHLVSLELRILDLSKMSPLPKVYRSFTHLRHLDWTWNFQYKINFVHLATLLDAAPYLELLKLQFLSPRVKEQAPQNLGKLMKMLPEHFYTNLQNIEIFYFGWHKWQIEIALYLLKNAVKLKSMMLENDARFLKNTPKMESENLRLEVPTNIKLLICNPCVHVESL